MSSRERSIERLDLNALTSLFLSRSPPSSSSSHGRVLRTSWATTTGRRGAALRIRAHISWRGGDTNDTSIRGRSRRTVVVRRVALQNCARLEKPLNEPPPSTTANTGEHRLTGVVDVGPSATSVTLDKTRMTRGPLSAASLRDANRARRVNLRLQRRCITGAARSNLSTQG